jgi:hypothetical protein
MRTIDVKKVIDSAGLDFKEVAAQLFPKNKYPDLALNRVIKGVNALDADQISKLALMANVPISDLFSGGEWKAVSKGKTHIFSNGDYKVELDTETWISRIFHKGSLFHESVIHSGSTPLSEYLENIDVLINQFQNK